MLPIIDLDNQNIFLRLLFFLLLSYAPVSIAGPDTNPVSALIDEYRAAYPEIDFVLLEGSDDFDRMYPFRKSLGQAVSNVDYEHPEDLREKLIEAQEYRVSLHLNEGNGSSTLFHTPDSNLSDKAYTCVITLPDSIQSDPLSSSRFIYGIAEKSLEKLPGNLVIDNDKFLQYSIDHEIFHCIDAFTNGPSFPMTTDPAKASLDRYIVEQRTETFSALRHLHRYPDDTDFINSLVLARSINLLNLDFEHYTRGALLKVLESRGSVSPQNIRNLAGVSMDSSKSVIPDYAEYLVYLASLGSVLEKYNIPHDLGTKFPHANLAPPDGKKVDDLVSAIQHSVDTLNLEH